ncbi:MULTISPECIES: rubrerythrin [Caproicibacterium]|uniref:Rubrerythrin n=1 Tax=Caproicibacterium argilliputei TaxID=3030016 RepID=A0AA97D8G6_9FIRM|nr:rubrerythrin [Caproicibacterium argilliputei]WOC31629.1 rubrerythrin [Caproicibacterium argilliputei]
MQHEKDISITTHDRLLRAWENSMELVRDFESYAKEITDDPKTADVFAKFAEDEGQHASRLREILHQYQN